MPVTASERGEPEVNGPGRPVLARVSRIRAGARETYVAPAIVPEGVTGEEAAEAGPVPTALVAVTVNVYGVPLVRPETVQERAPLVVQVEEPGELVAVYPVIGLPPVLAGAVQETRAEVLPGTAPTPVGRRAPRPG